MKRVSGTAGLVGFWLATTSCWGQAPLAPAPATQAGTATAPKQAIEEVVVTAQLRSQKIQKVPISINAFSAAFIKQTGSQNLGDLQYYTPGLSVDDTSTTQPTYSIRGVRPDDFGVGTDPAVGIYVDGFYSARSGEALVFFDDVSRVEVLKGPQGTLFGRNTAAGAISIITNKPTDKYEATFDEKIGNYGKTEETVMVNIPVTDTFSVRVDGLINRRSGYLTNDYNGDQLNDEHNESARVAARWQPSTDTDVIFAWDHDNTNVTPPTALGIGQYAGNGGNPYAAIYDRVINGQESRRLDDLSLTAKHDFDNFTLTSLSGYKFFSTQNRESETGSDIAARYFDTENVENNHSFYQELRANGVWGDLTWVGGVSYYQERAKQQSIATALTDSIDTLLSPYGYGSLFAEFGLLGLPWQEAMNNLGQYNAVSVFGDATYAITPALNLTVGARFTDDNKKFSWQAPDVVVIGAGPANNATIRSLIGNLIFTYPGIQGNLISRSDGWTNVSPRFVLDYHWAEDVMTYASATFGYKAGGFNSVEINSEFKPETIQNYELGLKSDWLQHQLRVNLTGYYYFYRDFQSISLAAVQNSRLPEYVTQSGNLEGKGVDLEVIWLPARNLTLSLDGGYVDSIWQKFLENETTLSGEPVTLNLAGQPTGEPELRIVNGIDYLYSLGQNGNLRFHATNSFTSAERQNAGSEFEQAQIAGFVNFNLLPGFYKSHDLTDARLTWSDAHDHYEVALYAQNLFDNIYVTDINYITATTLRTPYVRPEAPRFWGAELTYKF
jgi:iron complex outermembrane receptor protein